MNWLRDTLGVYGRVLRRALQLTVTHWWLGLVSIAYELALYGVALATQPLGRAGGFIVTLAGAALFSSWLVLVGHVVRSGRTSLADVRDSFFVYIWDVLTFGFLVWILVTVVSTAIAGSVFLGFVFAMALFVFLSAVPEQIYLGGQSGMAILFESYRFVGTNWIEWLPATALLAIVAGFMAAIPVEPIGLVAGGIGITFMFVARGLLFLELNTSSRRARDFHRRAAG